MMDNELQNKYNCAAELYRIELCKLWDIDYNQTYWVADRVGDALDVCDVLGILGMDEIRLIVDNAIPLKTIEGWKEYNLNVFHIKQHLNTINLRSWIRGVPIYYGVNDLVSEIYGTKKV